MKVGIKFIVIMAGFLPTLFAHVSIDPSTLSGSNLKYQVIRFRIPHACSNTTSTVGITITLPGSDKVTAVKGGFTAGWTSSVKVGQVANFTLSAGYPSIPNNEFADFALQVSLDVSLKSGGSLSFPTTQICQDGTTKAWDGEDSPILKITEAGASGNLVGTNGTQDANSQAIAIAGLVISIVSLLLAILIVLKINSMTSKSLNVIQPAMETNV